MITAEGIVCRIPSETAVKVTKFFCASENPVSPLDSQTLATWAGVVVTTAALIFARRAWRESKSANAIALSQIEESVESVEKQINAQRETALEQMQLEQLGKYCETLIWFVNHAKHISDELQVELKSNQFGRIQAAREEALRDFEVRKRELTARWMSWSMYLIADDPDFRDATNNHMSTCMDTARDLLDREVQRLDDVGVRPASLAAGFSKMVIDANLNDLFVETGGMVANIQCVMLRGDKWENYRENIIEKYPNEDEESEAPPTVE